MIYVAYIPFLRLTVELRTTQNLWIMVQIHEYIGTLGKDFKQF